MGTLRSGTASGRGRLSNGPGGKSSGGGQPSSRSCGVTALFGAGQAGQPAFHEQTIGRLMSASRAKPDHEGEAWVTPVFIAAIILCGVVIVLGALISI